MFQILCWLQYVGSVCREHTRIVYDAIDLGLECEDLDLFPPLLATLSNSNTDISPSVCLSELPVCFDEFLVFLCTCKQNIPVHAGGGGGGGHNGGLNVCSVKESHDTGEERM